MSPTADSTAYESLRAAILSLDLLPGEKLSERGLETLTGASRTPIRAALMRLENEGLTHRDGRGWKVSPIDIAELRAVLEFRETIEVASVAFAIDRAGDKEISAFRFFTDGNKTSDSAAAVLRDGGDFHLAIAQLSKNPFMIEATRNALTRLSRTRWLGVQTSETRAKSRSEHLGIINALEQRETLSAQRLMSEHSRETRDMLLTALSGERLKLRSRGYSIIESSAEPNGHPEKKEV